MQGNAIPDVTYDKHLGHTIGKGGFHQMVDECITELYRNTNVLVTQFYNVDIDIKYRLFKSYCMSVYGCQLWNFEDKQVENFYTAWRKCTRKLFTLLYKTHCRLLHIFCNDIPIEGQLHMRFLNFVKACENSHSKCVRLCCKMAIMGSMSRFSQSISYVCAKWNLQRDKGRKIGRAHV